MGQVGHSLPTWGGLRWSRRDQVQTVRANFVAFVYAANIPCTDFKAIVTVWLSTWYDNRLSEIMICRDHLDTGCSHYGGIYSLTHLHDALSYLEKMILETPQSTDPRRRPRLI
jgi:hypothetical protein